MISPNGYQASYLGYIRVPVYFSQSLKFDV